MPGMDRGGDTVLSTRHEKFTRSRRERITTPLPVKIAVLKRLSAITSEDISIVLMEIADDLRRENNGRKAA